MTTPKKQKKQPQRKKDLTPTKGRLVRGRKLFGDDDDDATPQKAAPAPAPKKTIQQQIKDAFYNPKTGLWNASKIYKKLKAQGVKVKLKDVKAVLDQQLVTQVYKPVPKKKKDRYITIIAKAPRHQYQADLLDLKSYAKFNKNFRYLLNVVDVYPRYAYAVPVKTKTGGELIPAFEQVFDEMGKPENLNTDLEAAILGSKFQAVLQKGGIRHYQHNPVDDKRNMSIVERFNRTPRDVLVKYFYSRDTKSYLDILPDLLANYNSTVHSTTKQQPVQIWGGGGRRMNRRRTPRSTPSRWATRCAS